MLEEQNPKIYKVYFYDNYYSNFYLIGNDLELPVFAKTKAGLALAFEKEYAEESFDPSNVRKGYLVISHQKLEEVKKASITWRSYFCNTKLGKECAIRWFSYTVRKKGESKYHKYYKLVTTVPSKFSSECEEGIFYPLFIYLVPHDTLTPLGLDSITPLIQGSSPTPLFYKCRYPYITVNKKVSNTVIIVTPAGNKISVPKRLFTQLFDLTGLEEE